MNPYAPPTFEPATAAALANPSDGRELEFDAKQNSSFTKLASSMKLVGIVFIVFGALGALGGVCSAAKGLLHALSQTVSGLAWIAQGGWVMNAAKRFDAIATTSGRDVTNLFAALRELRKYYLVVLVASLISTSSGILQLTARSGG